MLERLSLPVGPGRPNVTTDVQLIQRLLNRQTSVTQVAVIVSGRFDLATEAAIQRYQTRVMRMQFPTGVIMPDDATFLNLTERSSLQTFAQSMRVGRLRLVLGDIAPYPTPEQYAAAASELACDPHAIQAVQRNESPGGGFDDPLGRPTILYEPLLFARLTKGRFSALYPRLSGGALASYGRTSRERYRQVEEAYSLDSDAALSATSWGLFQILGVNFKACGYGTAATFVQGMCLNVESHLNAFVQFVQASHRMWDALKRKDWAAFSYAYNGPAYRKNLYDSRLSTHYNEIVHGH